MKLIAQLKLLPTPEQADALKRTLVAANDACNYISAVAWETHTFGKFPLQKLVYQAVRDTLQLGAQLVVRCVAKVADAYKLDRETQRTFRPTAAVAFDDRNLSWNLKGSEVSIWTLDGRQAISFVCGERQRQLLETRSGQTDLCLVNGQLYLFATCDVDEPDPLDVAGALGVDLGIITLATDSDGESFSGERIERRRQWYASRRQAQRSAPHRPNVACVTSRVASGAFRRIRTTLSASGWLPKPNTRSGRLHSKI